MFASDYKNIQLNFKVCISFISACKVAKRVVVISVQPHLAHPCFWNTTTERSLTNTWFAFQALIFFVFIFDVMKILKILKKIKKF